MGVALHTRPHDNPTQYRSQTKNTMNNTYPWHSATLKHIESQLHDNRQPHATLFRLRADYDDEQLGWEIAKRLLCDQQTGCNACKHCRLMNENAHTNALFLDVINDKVGIDQVRELEQQMWQTALFDKPKVAYIQGMDLLSLGAQNALLKTLEEPPENAFFVLSVSNISRVLPTIMSRVQRLHHAKVDQDSLYHWLQKQLNNPVTEAAIARTAKLVDDAPLRTLALLKMPELGQKLQQEKAQFADFISKKISASTLTSSLDKDEPQAQLQRYCRYTESLIHVLFQKSISDNSELGNKRADNRQGNSVQYATWNGVSLRALYRLHDSLTDLRRLADSNVNLTLQFTTSLTEWQHER
ncbi:MAG: hypothetical protein CR974_03035 [Gammaproteobacteria bacterium]|nr:MAG: hypothetical protein CR974_03035 [Gammaproteobacteria bacterium]